MTLSSAAKANIVKVELKLERGGDPFKVYINGKVSQKNKWDKYVNRWGTAINPGVSVKFYKNTSYNRKNCGIIAVKPSVNKQKDANARINITFGKICTGKTLILRISGNGSKVKWSTSNKKVATVSSKGIVTGKKSGTATITAKTSNGKYASCTVTVKNPAPAYTPYISLSKRVSSGSSSGRIDVTAFPCGAVINWYSSNSNVVSVDSFGNITARGSGIATITASMRVNGQTYSQSINLTVGESANYGSWSNWTPDPITGNAYTQVDTATIYRYYCFYCPACGGREPYQGRSDCHKYNLTLSDARAISAENEEKSAVFVIEQKCTFFML